MDEAYPPAVRDAMMLDDAEVALVSRHPARLTALALALAVTLPTTTAAAGPWAPRPGHGYAKIWAKYLFGFGFWGGDGRSRDYGGYHEAFVAAYGEVGLVDRLAAVVHTDIIRTFHLQDPRDGTYQSHLGPGDPYLGLRAQLLALDRFALGVEIGARAPFARAGVVQTVYGTDEESPELGGLRVGTGVWDVPASVSAGYGWDAWYLAGSVGYVLRTGGFDHAVTWTAEGGATLREEGIGIRGRVVGFHSVDVQIHPAAPRAASPSGMGNGTSYIGFAVEADLRVSEGLFVGATVEGGLGALRRQTGGPVITTFLARRF